MKMARILLLFMSFFIVWTIAIWSMVTFVNLYFGLQPIELGMLIMSFIAMTFVFSIALMMVISIELESIDER